MPRSAAPTPVRFEHRTGEDPVLGIGTATPRLSWRIPQADADFEQAAYQVELVRDDAAPETFTVDSADQILVPWPAAMCPERHGCDALPRGSTNDDARCHCAGHPHQPFVPRAPPWS